MFPSVNQAKMIPIYVLAVAFLLSLTTSQFVPIDLDSWQTINSFTSPHSVNCETIGGYNYQTNKIQIYGGDDAKGGNDTAKYMFDGTDRDYEFEDLAYYTAGNEIIIDGSSTQRHGTTPDNILYFKSGGDIKGIDMNNDAIVNSYSTLVGTQGAPGLCMDDENNILYAVGEHQISKCDDLQTATPGTCSPLSFNKLDLLQEAACTFYEGNIFIFGGMHKETTDIYDTVWKCDPETADSCEALPSLETPRKSLTALTIQCFNKNYIALIGGSADSEVSSLVEIYDLKSEDKIPSAPANAPNTWRLFDQRRQFSAVFDPVNEQIFVFGGRGSLTPSSDCLGDVEVTVSGNDGLCYTMDPTMDPTATPSVDPSSSPVKPPSIPTTNVPYKPQTEDYSTPGSAYGIIITILVLICCIILCCFFWYSREENDHVYGRMPVDMGVVAGGAAVPMAVVTYCDSCSKPTPCSCNSSCGKCGKSSCNNECGYKCTSCGTTSCDGRACNKTATTQ